MKILSTPLGLRGNKGLIAVMASVTLSVAQSADAALITVTDDGTDTTIAWSGSFDDSSLLYLFSLTSDGEGPNISFSSDTAVANDGDIFLRSGAGGHGPLRLYDILGVLDVTGGWTDPSGDFISTVLGSNDGMFYLNAAGGYGGFSSRGDGAVVLAGSLVDNGFTANESITFNNTNVAGETGQIRMQTYAAAPVPEPSSMVLSALGGLSLLARRKRKRKA